MVLPMVRRQMIDLVKAHFPEYISGYCSCGARIPTLDEWATHVSEEYELLMMDNGQKERKSGR